MSSQVIKTSQNADLSIGRGFAYNIDSEGFPLVLSADGHVCWPVTDYLIHRYTIMKRKISTVTGNAYSLSLLTRFIGPKQKFRNMNDSIFVDYRDFLLEDHGKGKSKQINKHLNTARMFLMWYDNKLRKNEPSRRRIIAYSTEENHVDAQINIFVTEQTEKRNNKSFTAKSYHHEAFLIDSIANKRHPIPSVTIDMLWNAIPQVCASNQRRKRDELALLLFELLGARRCEIFQLTTADCLNAIKTHKIILVTAKKDKPQKRVKEIPTVLADRLKEYIYLVRNPAIKKAIKKRTIPRDHGLLLIKNTGEPWKQKSFNTELDLLAEAAGITEPVHPHLFRHRLHTRLASESSDLDYRKQLLVLKASGGWQNDLSPATYIDIDAMESEAVKDVISKHLQKDSNHAIRHLISSKLNDLRACTNDVSITTDVDEVEKLINSLFSANK